MENYLARIDAERPARADTGALADLHVRHLYTVPFENLSIHLGEPIVLTDDDLVDKVVRRRRGGFCYELNGAFAALLRALGYEVTLLAAKVFGGGELGPPFDHLALRVDAPDPWLVDVGFGRHSYYPLRMVPGVEQDDPGGTFRLVERDHGDIDVLRDGIPQYRVEPRPRELSDFEPTCWWQATSPTSNFTQRITCSLLTEDGRITLSRRTLIRTVGDERREEELASDEDVLAAYRTYFGIALDRVPYLRAPTPASTRTEPGVPV